MPLHVCYFEPKEIDYFLDFPACTAASLLPGASFRATTTQQWLLYTQSLSTLNGPRYHLPVVFEVIGQISRRDCFLTSQGDTEIINDASLPCWLEPPPSNAEGDMDKHAEQWTTLLTRLEEIARSEGEDVITSELVSWVSEGNGCLQVAWDLTDPFTDVRAELVVSLAVHSHTRL